jgi:Relaxase/Mobilisation nuclease domain
MIAVSSSGKTFRALAAYLANGRTGEEQDRVAWAAGRNLPTSDPELAATFMQATAARSDRIQKPVYHVALSFDPNDPVDRANMERVADRVLERLGLAEHQALIVAHRDRAHAHLHLLVNRVHPDTGRAWERWKDRPTIQQVLREEERALGLREVAGRLASLDRSEHQGPELPIRDREGRAAPFLRKLAHDLAIYERVLDFHRQRYAAEIETGAARARVSEIEAARERARVAEIRFRAALASVYRDPEGARQEFLSMVRSGGIAKAVDLMRERPEALGRLVATERARAFGIVRSPDDRAARAAAPDAARKGREAVNAEHALHTLGALDPDMARTHIERSVQEEGGIREELGRLPRRPELEARISRALQRLLPREVAQLRRLLTVPQIVLANRLLSAARDVMLGREEERGS